MSISRHFDQISIALSTVCIAHCLAVPVLVAVLPIAAISLGDDAHFHRLMLWLVIPSSVVGFGMGYRVHARTGVVALGAVGVAALGAAALWGHVYWNELLEVAISVSSSLLLAGAHWLNFREVRRRHCHA